MIKRIRGRWFNMFQPVNSGILVESYSPESILLQRRTVNYALRNVITPTESCGRHKKRLLFKTPEGAKRLIGVKHSEFDKILGQSYGQLLLNYIKASPVVEYESPAYSYLDLLEPNQNSDLINDILHESPALKSLLGFAMKELRIRNDVPLHGRLTVGSLYLSKESRQLTVLSGKTKFMGPIEFDLACTLQNAVEHMVILRAKNQPDTHLVAFCDASHKYLAAHFDISRNLLACLLLYFHVGHLNTFQIVQLRHGKTSLQKAQVMKEIQMYWHVVNDLLQEMYSE